MSYEGYEEILCENGHRRMYDCWDAPVLEEWVCPGCGAKAKWWAMVDCTNGADPATGMFPGEVNLDVKDSMLCKCPDCGNSHCMKETTYHIPKDGGHIIKG